MSSQKRNEANNVPVDNNTPDFRYLVEKALVGMYIIQDNTFKYVNKRFCDIFGYSYDEVINNFDAYSMVYPSYRKVVADNIKRRLEREVEALEYEFKGQHKDGRLIWIKVMGNFIIYKNRPAISGTIEDITEKKGIQDQLRISEERLRLILETTQIGIWDWDVKNDHWYASPIYYTMLGYAPVEGRSDREVWLQRVHPDDRKAVADKINQVLKTNEKTYEYEARMLHANGTYRWHQVLGHIIDQDESGRISRVVGIRRDISLQKNIEQEVLKAKERAEESEFFLQQSQFAANIGSMKLDMSSGKMVTTTILDKILGIDEHFVKNLSNYQSLISLGYQEEFGSYLQEITQKKQVYDFEYPITRQNDKETRWLHAIGKVYYNEHGAPGELLCTVQDVTEKRLLEEEKKKFYAELEKRVEMRTAELKQANAELEAFAYSVSHDLKAPLRHINGFLGLLKNSMQAEVGKPNKYVGKIQKSTESMAAMIEELLRFSRLGRANLKVIPLDLSKIINSIIQQLKPDYAGRNIKWEIKALPFIKGDSALIKIAFENIISNAIKYTARTEQAIVEIGEQPHVQGGMCCVYVKDNGVGFDMAYKDKLFGVFQRLHSNEEFEGIGIGLANVKKIVAKHNGFVSATSKKGEGATFYIHLPYASTNLE